MTDASGWGKGFRELLREHVECINLAQSGRSSRSFRTEGWWKKCIDSRPDWILIQFGHNDQPGKGPERESAADGDFRKHLKEYVDEAQAAGIRPILVTPLTRRRWNAEHRILPSLSEYSEATTSVAAKCSVPLIDLHALSIGQCEEFGPETFRAFEPMTVNGADHTHLNEDGGQAVAVLVARALLDNVPEMASLLDPERLKTMQVSMATTPPLTSGTLSLLQTPTALEIRQADRLVLAYQTQPPHVPSTIDPIFARSGFLHPVRSPTQKTLTEVYPFDHPHQSGIFSAWVRTRWNERDIDFWNLAGGTGRVSHQRIVRTFAAEGTIGFETDLVFRTEQAPIVDVLRDRWRIRVHETDGSYHAVELDSTQSALTDLPLVVQKYHYGGVAFRGSVRWLTDRDGDSKVEADSGSHPERELGRFLNEQGSDRLQGNHQKTRWVCFTGLADGQPVSLAMLSHQDNFRAPQPARLHPTKPYCVFCPCVEEEFVIDREHPLRNRYLFLITDAEPDEAWISRQWSEWVSR